MSARNPSPFLWLPLALAAIAAPAPGASARPLAASAPALEALVPRAEAGDAEAQRLLGDRYLEGDGVDKDAAQAARWYRRAAEQGDARAPGRLGWLHEIGAGVDRDDLESVRWYRLAAEQGHREAQASLGWHYQHGRGTEPDAELAKRWYAAAGAQGDAGALVDLADLLEDEARLDEAEAALARALALRRERLGADHGQVADTLYVRGRVARKRRAYAEAEMHLDEALALYERRDGRRSEDVARVLHALGVLAEAREDFAAAAERYRAAADLRREVLGEDSTDYARSLRGLGAAYGALGRYAEAVPPLERALAIVESAWPADDPGLAAYIERLGMTLYQLNRHAEVVRLLGRSLSLQERALGADHPDIAAHLYFLANVRADQGRHAEAGALLDRAAAIFERISPQHPMLPGVLVQALRVRVAAGEPERALAYARRAADLHEARAARDVEANRPEAASLFVSRLGGLDLHVGLLHLLAGSGALDAGDAAAEALRVLQIAGASRAGAAISRMAARFASGDDALARVVRERQDTLERLRAIDAALVGVMSTPLAERDRAREAGMRERLAALERRLDELDAALAREFPEFAELANPRPLALDAAQRLLGAGEALVCYLLGAQGSYLIAVRGDRAELHRLDLDRDEIAERVQRLRRRLDPGAIASLDELGRFPVEMAHDLHERLLAPAAPLLAGARHLLVVPDGALESLPFGVLVTAPPPRVRRYHDYREVPWLARERALTVLPSVSSLRALRRFAKPARAREPFVGFGDPLLEGERGPAKGVDVAALFSRGPVAVVEEVRRLPRLRETERELYAIADALGAGRASVHLRDAATETRVKGLDLSRYRVLTFSTHGLMAGEFRDVSEPALVLTPPAQGSAHDDGLLTASEVAQLSLDAEWVVLSACNTAAADGTPGAQGLSGLAKAFFYAGSRALLVSHWAVSSDATVALTTAMFRTLAESPAVGRAEALRRSMLALMHDPQRPHHAHPLFWAPFTVVGEGAAR